MSSTSRFSIVTAGGVSSTCGLWRGVTGRGVQKGIVHGGRGGQAYSVDMLPKVKLEMVVIDTSVDEAVDIIQKSAWTGNIGDGKIFVSPVDQAIRVRTGERGDIAV